MNNLRKTWCRSYQAVFRVALPILPYREPKPLVSVDEVPDVLLKKKLKNVLIVTDKGVRSNGLTARLEQVLAEADIEVVVYDETCPNPTLDNIEDAAKLYREKGCQALIGVGGGSSMDCAKGVGVRIAKPQKSFAAMEGVLKVRHRLPLLVAIPTTAGTGSETTLAAVVTDSQTQHKYAINDFPLIPRYAVLDPAMTYSLPPHLTATTGMDALVHAVEAYIGRSSTASTRKAAVEAVRMIFANIEIAYRDGKNVTARKNMLRAAYLAGKAFTKSYVGYVHAVAHSLGGKYHTPHGLANAVLLPIVLEEYGAASHRKLARLARLAYLTDTTDDAEAARVFIQKVRDLNKNMNIPEKLPNIVEADIPQLAKYADHEGNPLYPVPVLWDAKELERIYYLVKE